MNDRAAWCIVAVPSEAWAHKVFPTSIDPVGMLWKTIFDVCRVSGGDPVGEWKDHVRRMSAYRDRLNELDLESVRMTSANGTDLTVGLADGAVWEGAESVTPAGQTFIANLPTEEVFTAPHKDRVDGIVYATKPYVYHGDLIEGLWVRFEAGRVVEHGAEKNDELLGMLLSTDEGSRSIGELALVPKTSPINRAGVLFYNTLFDENAACHIAFGDGYPGTVAGGTQMDQDALLAHGVNHSLIHEDVMVGAEDMTIAGTTRTGRQVAIFANGEWCL
jgi:aminopeptidase